MSKLCVVIPTFNEAENLPRLTARLEKALGKFDFSLIVIDDNSPDRTAEVAKRLGVIYRNIIVKIRPKRSGLGSAVLEGMKIALSMNDVEKIVTMDSDMSHNPDEILRLLDAARKTDLVQGSRYIRNGKVFGWGLKRRLISLVANLVCKIFLRISLRDCTGNFRVYSRRCAEMLLVTTSSVGFEWVVEAMFVARRQGYKVKEVPISFTDRRLGKTKLRPLEVLSWITFACRRLALNPRISDIRAHSASIIQKSSTLTLAATSPTASTTKYTLSSTSPDLSIHAESTYLVKSNE